MNEKVKKIVKWIAVIAAAIDAAAAVIMEQGCTHKHFLKANGIKSNMKNKLMGLYDKITLRKRSVIETINDELKNICQIEHTRHRAMKNFIMNLISALAAYCFFDKKP